MTHFPGDNPIIQLNARVRRLIDEINGADMSTATAARMEDLHRQMRDSRKSEWWSSLARSVRQNHYAALASLLYRYAPLKLGEVMEQMIELEEAKVEASRRISRLSFTQTAEKAALEAEVNRCIHNTVLCNMIRNRAETDAKRAARIFEDYTQGQTWPPRDEWDEELPASDAQYGYAIRDLY
nr:hypothetical protein CFP56_19610 [Quercus suber]